MLVHDHGLWTRIVAAGYGVGAKLELWLPFFDDKQSQLSSFDPQTITNPKIPLKALISLYLHKLNDFAASVPTQGWLDYVDSLT